MQRVEKCASFALWVALQFLVACSSTPSVSPPPKPVEPPKAQPQTPVQAGAPAEPVTTPAEPAPDAPDAQTAKPPAMSPASPATPPKEPPEAIEVSPGSIVAEPMDEAYEAKEVDRLWIIPWDLDMSMNDATNPPHIETDWRKTPDAAACAICEGGGASGGPPPGCDPVIKGWQALKSQYDAKVDHFIRGPFSKATVDGNLAKWRQQLVSAGYPAPEEAAAQLIQILDKARANRGFLYP